MKRSFLIAGVVLALTQSLFAQQENKSQENKSQLTLATERVVVFKDGFGLMIKKGTATADAEGNVYTNQVPGSAVMGTFWATGEGRDVVAMKAEHVETQGTRKSTVAALTMQDLLRANIKKKMTLTVTDKDGKNEKTVAGTIAEVLERKGRTDVRERVAGPLIAETPIPNPWSELIAAERVTLATTYYRPVVEEPQPDDVTIVKQAPTAGGEYVVVDSSENGRTVLPVALIKSINGADVATALEREQEVFTRKKQLTISFGAEAAGKQIALRLFYFSPGIRWTPVYRADGDLAENANLSLQAELTNDLEDIKGAAVDLVVGVPNFRFKDVVSPLTLERMLHSAATATLKIGNGQIMSNSMNHWNGQQLIEDRGVRGEAWTKLSGSGEQDFFIYTLKDVSIKKGGTQSSRLWATQVPVKHVYTFDMQLQRGAGGTVVQQDRNDGNPNSPLKISTNRVWHQLQLMNNTTSPWTTGPVLLMKGNLPMAQELLTYTSPKTSTLVPMTVAVDMRAKHDEEEVSREKNETLIEGTRAFLISKKGTITLTNNKNEKTEMRITVGMGGKAEKPSDGGTVKLNDSYAGDWSHFTPANRLNNHSDITWNITLNPGESKTLTYHVSFYSN